MNVLSENPRRNRLALLVVFLSCSVLFSLLTVYFQEQHLTLRYIEEGYQIKRHIAVLQGTAGNAWQYRVLSEFLVEGVLSIFKYLGVPHPVASAFLSFRVFQNTLIFMLAALYYKKLGLNTYLTLTGLSILAWGMIHAVYYSDLQFSTYFDVVFYLLAGLIILHGKDMWIIPITGLAAMNRETSGFIPLMLFAARLHFRPHIRISKRAIFITLIACTLYVIIYAGLRFIYGTGRPYTGDRGFVLIKMMLVNYKAWAQMFATLGILPVMAILALRRWPRTLQAFFWTVVPMWFLIMQWVGGMLETRLYLVPHALVFIPGALLGAMHWNTEANAPSI